MNSLSDKKPKKNNFYVYYSEAGGYRIMFEEIKVFDSAYDAISFYRFYELPRIFGYIMGLDKKNFDFTKANYFLKKNKIKKLKKYLSNEEIKNLNEFLLIVSNIKPKDITQEILEKIKKFYNEIFRNTNPLNEIVEWGYLKDFLLSEIIQNSLDNYVKKGDIEMRQLKELFCSGKFNENR